MADPPARSLFLRCRVRLAGRPGTGHFASASHCLAMGARGRNELLLPDAGAGTAQRPHDARSLRNARRAAAACAAGNRTRHMVGQGMLRVAGPEPDCDPVSRARDPAVPDGIRQPAQSSLPRIPGLSERSAGDALERLSRPAAAHGWRHCRAGLAHRAAFHGIRSRPESVAGEHGAAAVADGSHRAVRHGPFQLSTSPGQPGLVRFLQRRDGQQPGCQLDVYGADRRVRPDARKRIELDVRRHVERGNGAASTRRDGRAARGFHLRTIPDAASADCEREPRTAAQPGHRSGGKPRAPAS